MQIICSGALSARKSSSFFLLGSGQRPTPDDSSHQDKTNPALSLKILRDNDGVHLEASSLMTQIAGQLKASVELTVKLCVGVISNYHDFVVRLNGEAIRKDLGSVR